jgi:DNA-binding PadR family transcriptional regulator
MNYMTFEPGIWEIAVLALLREAPMHPYQMQRLLGMRHKQEILALKRGSLYHAIRRLERTALIEVETTGRNGKRPERTIYRITPGGEESLGAALRRMVAVPRRESSEFMAAMSFLVHLPADEAAGHLEERCRRLEGDITWHVGALVGASAFVARIHLIESEYLIAMLRAELAWVRGLADDLSAGTLTWDFDEIISAVDAERAAANDGKE